MTRKANLPAACLFLFGFLLLPAADAGAEVEPERAGALYMEAFELLDIELSDQEESIFYGEREGEMSEPTRNRIREGLDVLARAASADTVDWQLEESPEELYPPAMFEPIARARNAARMGMWYIDDLGINDPEAALDVVENLLKMSRHLYEDGMLIHLLSSTAVEGIALAAVEDLAGHWEKQYQERVIAIIHSETPTRSVREVIANEAEYVLSTLRGALFSAPESASFAELLRISSIAILSDETWIGFEHVGLGISFRLEPGESRHGIELVSFDAARKMAVVRSEGEEAVVHLQSRKMAPIHPKRFFKLLGLESNGSIARQLTEDDGDLLGFPLLGASLRGDESEAEVALIILDEMKTGYQELDELFNQPFGALPTDRNPEEELVIADESNGIVKLLASTAARLRRTTQASATYRDMMVTGLRLLDEPNVSIPEDPFSPVGESLEVIIEEDFIEVRSRHEMRGGHRFRVVR